MSTIPVIHVPRRRPRPLPDALYLAAFARATARQRDALALARFAGMRVAEVARAHGDDLTGPEYSVALKGQLKLETKDQMQKRGLSSPDDGDALALTFAGPVARKDLAAGRRLRTMGRRTAESDYDVFSEV